MTAFNLLTPVVTDPKKAITALNGLLEKWKRGTF